MEKTYWAIEPTLDELLEKISSYYENLSQTGQDQKLRRSFAQYYGYGFNARTDQITAAGEQGEESRLSVNNYRSLLRYQLSLTTSERPAIHVAPINTDYDSIASATVGNDVLEYYMRAKNLEDILVDATEKSLWSGEGFVELSWNIMKGEFYAVDPDTQSPVMTGDIEYHTHNSYDAIRDVFDNNKEKNWIILRSWVNRYDLAEQYPEKRDEILSLQNSNDKWLSRTLMPSRAGKSDLVALYTFYHKKSPAVPEGKLVYFTETDKLLSASLPYSELPVYRITPAQMESTALGYTQGFDILGLQEGYDELFSAVLSNNMNFARQCILIPREADINYRDLSDGLSAIEYDATTGKIEALQLVNSSPETYSLLTLMQQHMSNLTGINEVVQGNPDANLRSGNAMALVAAQAIKYNYTLQRSYARLIEDVSTATLSFLKEFADAPRYIDVVGKTNRSYLKSFKKEDLQGVSRVHVEITSAISKTQAGRIEIANNLLKQGLIKRPEQYIMVLETGKLEPIIEAEQSELMNIRAENEELRKAAQVVAIATDNHVLHMREHKTVLDSPEARRNPTVTQAVLVHIQEHSMLWTTTDPLILIATGQQPPPMMGPPAGGPGEPSAPAMEGVPPDSLAPAAPASEVPNQPAPAAPPENAAPEDIQAYEMLNLRG